MSENCPICGCPTDGGTGLECVEAEEKRWRERLRALQHTTSSDGKSVANTDVTGRPEDRVLSYIFQYPGIYPDEIAEVLGMDLGEVVGMTCAMMEEGLIAPSGE